MARDERNEESWGDRERNRSGSERDRWGQERGREQGREQERWGEGRGGGTLGQTHGIGGGYGQQGGFGGYGQTGSGGQSMGSAWEGYQPGGYMQGQGQGQGMESGRRWGGQQGRGFRGRGPRSYRRSDERIREDVNDQLTQHDDVDAENIEVIVAECEITLVGFVPDRQQKRMAEDIAEQVPGVREVHNQLRVGQGGGQGQQAQGQGQQSQGQGQQSQGQGQQSQGQGQGQGRTGTEGRSTTGQKAGGSEQ